jgi:hypothetical protein
MVSPSLPRRVEVLAGLSVAIDLGLGIVLDAVYLLLWPEGVAIL